jgi:hypothetical protein
VADKQLIDAIAGTGIPPSKVTKVGFPPNSLREQRKVELRHGAMVEQGEPYPDPRAAPRKRSTYGGGR